MQEKMTEEEFEISMEALAPRLEKYADLLVNFAMCVKPGQELVISAPLEAASFVKRLVRMAYKSQVQHVSVVWLDDELERITFENVSDEWLAHVPQWQREFYNGFAQKGAAFLTLTGADPDAMAGVDMAKIALSHKAKSEDCKEWRTALDFGRCPWTIAGVPTRKWAQKIFPQKSAREAVLALWEALLNTARVSATTREDWETHLAMLEKSKRFMNHNRFVSLHYSASNGTDLTLGLSHKTIWEGGPMMCQDGSRFSPNIPTEEVFTTPVKTKTEGIVFSALPLVHAGSVVQDFWFRFENGRVIDYDARTGKDVLSSILETDDGAAYLGECALISKNTPIRQSGLLFYNTLYDENASCHLALGRGFPECYEGGFDIGRTELNDLGINYSAQHVDFMVGTDDLNIVGTCEDGTEVPVFVNGEWAWE